MTQFIVVKEVELQKIRMEIPSSQKYHFKFHRHYGKPSNWLHTWYETMISITIQTNRLIAASHRTLSMTVIEIESAMNS